MKLRTFAFLLAALAVMIGGSARAQAPTIKVGMASLSMFTIMFHVAQDKGFFEKEGVNVEINHFESGSINMKALLARAIDISDVEPALILSAVANGADLRSFASQSQRLHFALYAKKDITSMKELSGRTFGISGIGALPHIVIMALLEKEKMNPDKLQMMSVGGTGARLSALVAGKIDATVGEYSPSIEADPSLRRLLVVSPELPLYMSMATTAWSDTLKAKRDAIERYQRAMTKATRWGYDNKEQLLDVALKHIPLPREELSKIYDFYVLARVWAINGEIDRNRMNYMQELGLKIKTQPKPVDIDKIIDSGIYNKLMAELGTREYPNP